MHFVLISSVHIHAPLSHWASLTKHKFEDKIIKNFESDNNALKQRQAILNMGPCGNAQVTCP